MVDYKLIHEKREIDGSNYFVTRNVLPVVSGLVKLEGSRAVDNAQFEITGGHGIESDDIITFILCKSIIKSFNKIFQYL